MLALPSGPSQLGVPKPGCFKPGCLQFLHGSALLRPFALLCAFCALLRPFALLCALLRAFTCFCVRPRLERPRLGTSDTINVGWLGKSALSKAYFGKGRRVLLAPDLRCPNRNLESRLFQVAPICNRRALAKSHPIFHMIL